MLVWVRSGSGGVCLIHARNQAFLRSKSGVFGPIPTLASSSDTGVTEQVQAVGEEFPVGTPNALSRTHHRNFTSPIPARRLENLSRRGRAMKSDHRLEMWLSESQRTRWRMVSGVQFSSGVALKRQRHPKQQAGDASRTQRTAHLPHGLVRITLLHVSSRIFSEHAFKKASGPKELFVVPNGGHVDLYDRVNLIRGRNRACE